MLWVDTLVNHSDDVLMLSSNTKYLPKPKFFKILLELEEVSLFSPHLLN